MLEAKVVPSPGRPAGGGLVRVLADERAKLLGLGALRDGLGMWSVTEQVRWQVSLDTHHSTGVEIALQAALGPGAHGLVKGILSGLGRGISCLGGSRADAGCRGTECRGRRTGDCVTHDLGAVLTNERAQLVELGALGNWYVLASSFSNPPTKIERGPTIDTVLVTEFLQLRLAPRIDEFVSQGGIGLLCLGAGRLRLCLRAQVGQTRVATN